MSNEMITQLPAVTSAQLTDIIYAVQGNLSVQETLQQVANLMLAQTILTYSGDPNGNVAGQVYQLLWDTTDKVLYVCTTSGSATTAVWTLAGSVKFPISLVDGGTNASLTASNGGIVYSTSSALAILSGTSTANQIILSGASSAPTWSTATFASSYSASTILYSNGANTVEGLATQNSAVLVTNNTGVPAWTASMTNGQILIGSTGTTPVLSTLTAGTNITITNTAGAITISATGPGSFSWTIVSSTSQAMSSNNGYITDNASLVSLSLPTTSIVGDELAIMGMGAGGWKITQAAGQQIHLGSSATTSGTGGSLSSTNQYDSIYLVCIVANTTWSTLNGPQGIITVV